MKKLMIIAMFFCLAMLFTACSPHENINENPVMSEPGVRTSEMSEPDETVADGISYPIENADPSIGEFGNELLDIYSDELVSLLNQWLDEHKNGTFEEIQNHHPAYLSDFPPVNQLPVIDKIEDVTIAWRESVMLDAYTEKGGGVFIVVPIDGSHIYILEPAKFSDADNNISIGFAYSGFQATSIEDFIAQSEIDYWFGGKSESRYDELVKKYKDEEMAVIFPSDRTETNIHLVERWVLDYQKGTPATLPVYWFGMAGPSIMIIESHGWKEYTMDIYSRNGTSVHYTSSYVVERKYDYVFGADFPSDIHPIAIQKKLAGDNAYEWDGKTALGSLGMDEVLAKAKDIGSKVTTYFLYRHNIRASGIYMSESVMSVATPFEGHRSYKIREARELYGELFYVIDCYEDGTEQTAGDPIILSADGTNAFLLSLEDGSWIYCYDENEKTITPNKD